MKLKSQSRRVHEVARVNSRFLGIGAAIPERVITNLDLEGMVDTSDEWIRSRTGIAERRVAREDCSTSDLGAEACLAAIATANIDPEEIDLVIACTSSPDMVFPSTACMIQGKLGIPTCAAFDVMAVCTGFIYALSVADAMIRTNRYQKVLVVGADAFSKLIDWTDRNTCILFGDGAGAAVLEPSDDGGGILNSYLKADGSGWDQLYIPAGGTAMPASIDTVRNNMHSVRMRGSEVFKFAVRAIPEACSEVLAGTGYSLDDVDYIVPHQANQRIIASAAKKLDFPIAKMPSNLDRYGNTSTASIPILLDEMWRGGALKSGQLLITVGFGSGLTWGANLIKWNAPPFAGGDQD